MKKLKRKHLLSLISVIFFKVVIEYGYFNFVYIYFSYSGFIVNESIFKMVESYAIVAFLSVFMIRLDESSKVSKIVVYILFLNLYIPLSSLFWIQDNSRLFYYAVSACFVLLALLLSKKININIPKLKEGNYVALLIIIFTTIIVYIFLILTGGLQRINLDLLNVYDTREKYAETQNVILGYLVPWQAHVINLSLLTVALLNKNKKLLFSSLALQIFLFSMTNLKSFLFAPVVVIGVYAIVKKGYQRSFLFFMSFGLTIVLVLMLILYRINGEIFLLSTFLRRLFFVPASLHYTYYEFFLGMPKYNLSTSILEGITHNPYGVGPVSLIADNVFGRNFSPNAGFFADAYLNFGLIGLIIFTFLLAFVLIILDDISKGKAFILGVSIIIIPAMSLINSAFFTALMTHGLFFAILIIWLMKQYIREY